MGTGHRVSWWVEYWGHYTCVTLRSSHVTHALDIILLLYVQCMCWFMVFYEIILLLYYDSLLEDGFIWPYQRYFVQWEERSDCDWPMRVVKLACSCSLQVSLLWDVSVIVTPTHCLPHHPQLHVCPRYHQMLQQKQIIHSFSGNVMCFVMWLNPEIKPILHYLSWDGSCQAVWGIVPGAVWKQLK